MSRSLTSKVKFYLIFNMASCPTHNFCLLWHCHIIFDTWIYQHEMSRIFLIPTRRSRLTCIRHIYLWIFDIASCSDHTLFVLSYSHTIFGTCVYHYLTVCHTNSWTFVWSWSLTLISKLCFHNDCLDEITFAHNCNICIIIGRSLLKRFLIEQFLCHEC